MAKETATPAPAETKAEKKPEKKAPAESVYTVSELAGNARSVFGTMQESVLADILRLLPLLFWNIYLSI